MRRQLKPQALGPQPEAAPNHVERDILGGATVLHGALRPSGADPGTLAQHVSRLRHLRRNSAPTTGRHPKRQLGLCIAKDAGLSRAAEFELNLDIFSPNTVEILRHRGWTVRGHMHRFRTQTVSHLHDEFPNVRICPEGCQLQKWDTCTCPPSCRATNFWGTPWTLTSWPRRGFSCDRSRGAGATTSTCCPWVPRYCRHWPST